jgi:hypothetical protein
MAIELKTKHSDFADLHEITVSGRGRYRPVERDLLLRLLVDHARMPEALRGQVKEP